MDILNLLAEHCIPKYSVTIRPRDKPWFTSELRYLIRKRNRFFKDYKITNNNATFEKYKTLRNLVVKKTKRS